jgi:hypothetical protein
MASPRPRRADDSNGEKACVSSLFAVLVVAVVQPTLSEKVTVDIGNLFERIPQPLVVQE